ncbi:MAG: hypothetical protein KDE15_04810 [Erythrobacter sp.]|nr:hypothetical protein [Erythrobacter sp.]
MSQPRHLAAPLLATLLALACAACVTEEAGEQEPIAGLDTERQCFFPNQINGYSEAPDGSRGERIYVRTGVRERFLVETLGSCPDIDWSLQLGIDPRFNTGSYCTGDQITLVVPRSLGGAGPDRCMARVLGRMVDEEG